MEGIIPSKHGMNEGKNADFTMRTVDSEGSFAALIARIENLQIRRGSGHTTPTATSSKVEKRLWPTNWPVKQDMYAHYNITPERHRDNMCLLLQDFALRARHIARLTRNWEGGEIWPTVVEPAALELSETFNTYHIDWRNVKYRPDYAEELDFVWRSRPPGLSANHINYKIIWEYVTGISRTWDKGRKESGLWFQNDEKEHLRGRCPGTSYHFVKTLRVPTIPQAIRTNQFIGVGDDETACFCSQPSPQCHRYCVHREHLARIKHLKKKMRKVVPAPVVEDTDELDCIE
ncbi:MAG: hypothetical protein Q9161_002095 [Pseudevernia consocians]